MKLKQPSKYNVFQGMRSWSLSLLATCTIIQGLALSATANPITYIPPTDNSSGSFSGEMPIKRIGPLLLPKAVVQLKGTDVNVLAVPDWLFDPNVVLAGTLVKAQIDVQGQSSSLRGLVYFSDGLWLSNIASQNALDIIDTTSGERYRGHIRTRLDNAFAFKPESGAMQKLLFTEIKNINSPRAYIFTATCQSSKIAPANTAVQLEASDISFSPTFAHGSIMRTASVPTSTLAGTEPGITKSQLTTMIGMNVFTDLAPAIAIPLALNRGTNSQAQRELNYYQQVQSNLSGIPTPITY